MTLEPHDLLWCTRRLPVPVRDLLKKHAGKVFVAGGFVRSCVANETINDVDLFVADKAAAEAMALELGGQESSVHRTDNAISVHGIRPMPQFIHRWTFDTPADALASFDFTIGCAAFWWTGEAWASLRHPSFYSDLASKRLVYLRPNRNEDAGGSMLRVLKFYQRGYRIPLDSLGAVVARLCMGVDEVRDATTERQLGKVLTGLLREVDPNVDPDHIAHLPSESEVA